MKAVKGLEILGIIILGFSLLSAFLKLAVKKDLFVLFLLSGGLAILSGKRPLSQTWSKIKMLNKCCGIVDSIFTEIEPRSEKMNLWIYDFSAELLRFLLKVKHLESHCCKEATTEIPIKRP